MSKIRIELPDKTIAGNDYGFDSAYTTKSEARNKYNKLKKDGWFSVRIIPWRGGHAIYRYGLIPSRRPISPSERRRSWRGR